MFLPPEAAGARGGCIGTNVQLKLVLQWQIRATTLFFHGDAYEYKEAVPTASLLWHGRHMSLIMRHCQFQHLDRDARATNQVRTPLLQVASGS